MKKSSEKKKKKSKKVKKKKGKKKKVKKGVSLVEQRIAEAQEKNEQREKEEKKKIFEAWTHGFDEGGNLMYQNAVLRKSQYDVPEGYVVGYVITLFFFFIPPRVKHCHVLTRFRGLQNPTACMQDIADPNRTRVARRVQKDRSKGRGGDHGRSYRGFNQSRARSRKNERSLQKTDSRENRTHIQ